jgi:NAD+ kinase
MKKVLIIINTGKKESLSLSQNIAAFLKQKNVECDFLNFDGFNENTPFSQYEFVITLGGDGTVLFAARNCVEYEIPVFPVNLGQFGFMASVQTGEWQACLESFLQGQAPFQFRSMLQASLIRNNKEEAQLIGLNDVVISARHTARTVAMEVLYDGTPLCRLKSDGAIISTPTGSTAYSASAGGPILDPVLDAIVLTPINSFSLSSRPIVLRADGLLCINIQPCRTSEICMIVDGQSPVALQPGDTIQIKILDKKIKLISCTQEKFFNALRSKLNWRGEPYA